MRFILGFDTATPTASVALFDRQEGRVVARADEPVRTHGKALMVLVDKVVEEAGADKRDLAAVVCGLGPGSFTGVRVGLATAKGICFALDIPLLGLSSLQALAGRVALAPELDRNSSDVGAAGTRSALLPCLDARRGEVYLAAYWRESLSDESGAGRDPAPEPWMGPSALRPSAVADALCRALEAEIGVVAESGDGRGGPVQLAVLGTGLELVGEHWAEVSDWVGDGVELVLLGDEDPWPDAAALVRYGAGLLEGRRTLDLDRAQPIYLRPSDAEENFGLDLSPKA